MDKTRFSRTNPFNSEMYKGDKLWSFPSSLFSLLSIRIPYVPIKFKSDDAKMAEFVSHATFLKSDLGPCVTIEYPLCQDLHAWLPVIYEPKMPRVLNENGPVRYNMWHTVWVIQYDSEKLKYVTINKSGNLSKTIWRHQKRTIGFGLDLNRYWNTWSVGFQVYKHIQLLSGPNSISLSNMKLPKNVI